MPAGFLPFGAPSPSSHFYQTMLTRYLFVVLAVLIAAAVPTTALVVPFTEDFAVGNSNWTTGNTNIAAGWSSTGGVLDGSYITSTGTVLTTGFGAIVFRGNAAADASGDAFVGDWLTGGVSSFSAFVRHDAPTALNFYARLDAGAGRAGSSIDFSVPANTWFQLSVPIVNSPSSFQSFGAGTFSTVFNGIQNVQIAIATNQAPSVIGQTYSIGLDRVSVVPEPGSASLLGTGAVFVAYFTLKRRRRMSTR
jgi:hypothetical protein